MRKYRLVLQRLMVFVLAINLQACGSIQQMVQGTITSTATLTYTPTLIPTATLTPTQTPTPTATPNLAATQQYDDFFSLVQMYFDAGHVSVVEGEYKILADFSEELNQNFGYQWKETGVLAKDFIVKADFDWSVADQKNYSGCGYVFRYDQNDDYYMLALDALDGVLMSYTKEGTDWIGNSVHNNYSITPIKKSRETFDMGTNPYHVIFTLIVNDISAYIYLNNKFYSEYELQKNRLTESGPLSYMILSGSDKDFGARCKITNVEAWVITP